MVEIARTYPMPIAVHLFRHVSKVLERAAMVCGILALCAYFLIIAHNDGVFGFEGAARAGIDRFLTTWFVVVLAGGVAAPLFLSLVTRLVQHMVQRRALNAIASDRSLGDEKPVSWQHAALRRKRASAPLMVLGIVLLVFFGLFTIVAVSLLNTEPEVHIGHWIVFWGALGLTVIGLVMFLLGRVRVKGPALDLWGREAPSTHHWEPARQYDDDGRSVAPSRHLIAASPRDRLALEGAAAPVVTLARLDKAATWAKFLAILPALVVFLSGGTGVVMRNCDTCVGRTHPPATEAFIDTTLRVGIGALALLAVLLLVGCALDTVFAVRLRPTLIAQASNLAAPRPPWHLLREALREEVPRQSVLGSVHTAAVICLTIGAAGLRTGPEYPLGDVFWVFQLLTTISGLLLLFHASAWFRHRVRTRAENEYLLRRWP